MVLEDRIEAVGTNLSPPPGAEIVSCSNCWILPGLIQGHVHLGQTLFRGLAEGRRLLTWLRERIWPLEAAHDAESTYWSVRLGAAECLLSGTTCVQEIGVGPHAESLLQALADSGLRALAGKCLMDQGEGLPVRLQEPTEDCLAETEALGLRWDRAAEGRLRYSLNPRFLLSCSEALWRGVGELAQKHGWPLHTHALEQREETQAVRRAWDGRDEIEVFADLGILEYRLSIAHGVWLQTGLLRRLAKRRFSVVHCPGSNLKLGSGVAPVVALRRAGIPVGIGTDGPPCNNRLNLWEELRLAHRLQALRYGPELFSARSALELATSEGARAIWLEGGGSLETGNLADLVVLEPRGPETAVAPEADPWATLLYATSEGAVRDVMVGGIWRVRSGALVGQDLSSLVAAAKRAAKEVVQRAGIT